MMTQEEIDRIIASLEDNVEIVRRLKAEGLDNAAIARWMGIKESAVVLIVKKLS
jgi:DNA-binding NarL/FixJ family response regulator